MMASLGALLETDGNYWMNCSAPRYITFTIGGQDFDLSVPDIVVPGFWTDPCPLAVQGYTDGRSLLDLGRALHVQVLREV